MSQPLEPNLVCYYERRDGKTLLCRILDKKIVDRKGKHGFTRSVWLTIEVYPTADMSESYVTRVQRDRLRVKGE